MCLCLMQLGTIPNVGLPRMLDMGQCNDSYGAVKVALALAQHFKTDINSKDPVISAFGDAVTTQCLDRFRFAPHTGCLVV